MLSLAVHAAPTQGIGVDAFDRLIEVRTLSHGFGQMIQMTGMIYGGVFDKFPKLKVAFAEAGCGWVPYLMERMDLEYEHRSAQVPELKRCPSEHLKSGRIFIHCELEERGIPRWWSFSVMTSFSARLIFPMNRARSSARTSRSSSLGKMSAVGPSIT